MKIVHSKLYLPSMTHDCDDNLGLLLSSSSIASFSGHSFSIQLRQCTQMCDLFCLLLVKKCFQIGSLAGGIVDVSEGNELTKFYAVLTLIFEIRCLIDAPLVGLLLFVRLLM